MVGRFTRTREDFKCGHCGEHVFGNGFTDHCPKCLYSKHVDVEPGDRASKCRGEMQPVERLMERDSVSISYKCMKCGQTKKVVVAPNDSMAVLENLFYNMR